jgi:hypothetical protein
MEKSEEQIRAEKDNIAFLSNCGMWPTWPACPVKNHRLSQESMPICGLVFDNNPLSVGGRVKCTPTVFILNMFRGWTKEEYDNCKKFKYDTIEEMVAAGWQVD